jgi:hypothetical protein
MRNLIILLSLFIVACSTNKKIIEDVNLKQQLKQDSLIERRKNSSIDIITKDYDNAMEQFRLQKNDWKKIEDLKNDLSSELYAKIEKDGGILKVLENILSKENFKQIDNSIIDISIHFVLGDGGQIIGKKVTFYNKGVGEMNFSEQEKLKLFNYVSELSYTYHGKELGNVYEGGFAGCIFDLRKK